MTYQHVNVSKPPVATRVSVRLDTPVYNKLLLWLAQQSVEHETRLTTSAVGAALFAELMTNQNLATRVISMAMSSKPPRA